MVWIPNQNRDLVFLDSETTGLDPWWNEAIEWAAIRTAPDGETVKEVYTARILPQFPERFDAKAREVNGFAKEAWEADGPDKAKPELEVYQQLQRVCKDAILVGQNVSFDENFLKAGFDRNGKLTETWHYHKVDVMNLAWPLIKKGLIEGLSLVHLCKFVGIEQATPHRALSDAKAAQTVYLNLLERYLKAL